LQDHYNPPVDIHEMSKDLAYWNFEVLSANINNDFVEKFPIAFASKNKMESSLLEAQEQFEQKALKKYEANPEKAIQMITDYSNKHANKSYRQTVSLLSSLKIPFPSAETKAIKIKDEVPSEKKGSK
jgi:dipeptidase